MRRCKREEGDALKEKVTKLRVRSGQSLSWRGGRPRFATNGANSVCGFVRLLARGCRSFKGEMRRARQHGEHQFAVPNGDVLAKNVSGAQLHQTSEC